ncbi:MAG: TrbC/VirB2 family protein [Sphingomonas sp.]|uniref:TrbC/VirB2 family protein n=1 Tax=Sphingomonas sp. TaxID=28214 RepID=UPI0025CB7CC7|nr:TrbC/VirB2 family protein [Sphingomonas sp.]MBX3564015.1 TrbC/VirB2 family protein [Sphingomonas sp.]
MLEFNLFASALSPSLADPIGTSPSLAAVEWLESAIIGSIAVSVAIVAIAALGLMMLAGRLPLRRSGTALLGCFILFGAPAIASGIMGAVNAAPQQNRFDTIDMQPGPPATSLPASPTTTYDPYAGASVPIR